MRIITDSESISNAQDLLHSCFEKAASRSERLTFGFHGGATEAETFWLPKHDIWYAHKKLSGRYWNAFGSGDPFSASAPSIVVEVNPPVQGTDRRASGAFAEDGAGAVYLVHRGRVGGGRKGIGKHAFLEWMKDDLQIASDEDGHDAEVIVLGSLDGTDLIQRIASFVTSVQAFKEQAVNLGPDEEVETADCNPWNEFIAWAKRFYEWEGFDADERAYKIEISERLKEAREAIESSGTEWFKKLKRAFGAPNNLTFYMAHGRFLDWVDENNEEALTVLRELWSSGDSAPERIGEFLSHVPKSSVTAPGNRINIASYLLMGDDPFSYPVFKPTPFRKCMALTAFDPPAGEETEASTYESALAFLDKILSESKARGLELRDRLDAQSILWSVVKGSTIEKGFDPAERERLSRYRGEVPSVWWVNQGENYDEELSGGYLRAPTKTSSGDVLSHWHNVSRLQPEDIVLHYFGGAITAISSVTRKAKIIAANEGGPSFFHARTEYFELADPIPLNAIQLEWRLQSAELQGPFTKRGAVKQTYLLPVGPTFGNRLKAEFVSRWPVGSPWAESKSGAWLFQANPKYWDLGENLRTMDAGDIDDWAVSRFGDEMKAGDPVILWQAGDEAGVYALGELSGEMFAGEAPEWWPSEQSGEGPYSAIQYRLTKKLDAPVLKTELIDHPVLCGLSVVKTPRGTNFRVSQEQWAAVLEVIGESAPPPPITFEGICSSVAREGLRISQRTLRRYHIAIQTRGFVILSGVSGTGKSWLTDAYARAIGAEYLPVPVAPNWTTNEDLLGYFNPLDRTYHDTEFSRFLRSAAREFEAATSEGREAKKYCLALDEMNLARVEYYFAKFLSVMEVRARRTASIELGPNDFVRLPPTLLFVGTVNVDETTHMFSDKVFDRAQLIELQVSRLELEEFLGNSPHCKSILEIWDVVSDTAPFAYRVVEEIRAYLDQAIEIGVEPVEALDEQILQKVLPKLSGAAVGPALERLVSLAADRYPLTREKTERMLADFQANGFASFF